jgi:DDE superfamily endonuclease
VICLDEMGPVAAKSYPGQQLARTEPQAEPQQPAQRAKQEIDYGRRDKGYVFGAFRPATGEALTKTYQARSAVNWVDFLQQVEEWLPERLACVYAIVDNLSTHRASDVLLFSLQHPRWEFVFQPRYAAYLNLIESWWKILRSLALKGRRFETWAEVEQAIEAATAYWNKHRHPFVWGRRRRHQPRRQSGIAKLPKAA